MRVSALSKGIVRCTPELRSAIETLAPHLASQIRLRRLLFPVGPGALFVAMVGQFRSAGGLVLLSGRILGAQIFLPVAYQAKKLVRRLPERWKSTPQSSYRIIEVRGCTPPVISTNRCSSAIALSIPHDSANCRYSATGGLVEGVVLILMARFAGELPTMILRRHRIVDVVGESSTSWEDAGRRAVETAATSIRDLRLAEVVKMDMKVENGKVTAFRTRVALSFKYEA
jgi:flavin-binding protein dodecin